MKTIREFMQIDEMRNIAKLLPVTVYQDGRDKKGKKENVLFLFMDKVEYEHSSVNYVKFNGDKYYPSDKTGVTFNTNKNVTTYKTDSDARINVSDDFKEIWLD